MVTDSDLPVYGGIDTHADTHHVAVCDRTGRPLGDLQVPATSAGYRAAVGFLRRWPTLAVVGIECTGSYGAGVTRAVRATGVAVVEVNRPNRFQRRLHGKTDTFDAYSAAEAVLSGRASAAPKGGDGLVESLRVLRTSRSSALTARTATINQIKAMLIAGPADLRERHHGLSNVKLVAVLAASRPTATPVTAAETTGYSLRLLARRWRHLTEQILDLTKHLQRLLAEHTPELMGVFGLGPDTAAQLLITAGDNPERLRGHGGGCGAGAQGGCVLSECHVADVVDGVLDRPVPAQVGAQFVGASLIGGEAGDAPGHLLGGALAVEAAGVADDPEHLRGVWEVDSAAVGDRCGAGDSLFGAAVSAAAGGVFGEPVGSSGQRGLAGGEQFRLVGLHGHDVVGVLVRDQMRGGGPLGMQGVDGHHFPGQVEVGDQRCHFEDFASLAGDFPLSEHDPVMGGDREQVRHVAAAGHGAAHALAVDRDRHRWVGGASDIAGPAISGGGPLRDRGYRVVPGGQRRRGDHAQHEPEVVAQPAARTRIAHLPEHLATGVAGCPSAYLTTGTSADPTDWSTRVGARQDATTGVAFLMI